MLVSIGLFEGVDFVKLEETQLIPIPWPTLMKQNIKYQDLDSLLTKVCFSMLLSRYHNNFHITRMPLFERCVYGGKDREPGKLLPGKC